VTFLCRFIIVIAISLHKIRLLCSCMIDLNTLLPQLCIILPVILALALWLARRMGVLNGQVALVNKSLEQVNKSNKDLERALPDNLSLLLQQLASQHGLQ